MAVLALPILFACDTETPSTKDEVDTGRRIYEEGILPDGSPLVATRPEGLLLEGQYAACATCHRRSGMGSIEGLVEQAILVPPLAGPVLFRDARFTDSWLNTAHHYVPNETWYRAMKRPGYNQASLDTALRDGLNSAGEELDAPMPRYDLDAASSSALRAYLEQLGAVASPGVENEAIHVATVITPDADPADAAALIDVVTAWTDSALGAGAPYNQHVWKLRGSADEWAAQLEAAYRERPVFALLSGLGTSEWGPVASFCERQEIACILPSVEVTPSDERPHFSMYFSAGVTLEARILAKHLSRQDTEADDVTVWQIHEDRSGQIAADALGSHLPEDWLVTESVLDTSALEDISGTETIVLWLRTAAIGRLVASFPDGLPANTVYISALLAAPEDLDLPPAWKGQVRFVSLFDDLGIQADIARLRLERWLKLQGIAESSNRRLQADAYAAAYLFNRAMAAIRQQEVRRPHVPFTREHLLETLEDIVNKYADGTKIIDPDSHIAWYGRMSLGPGQRYAARGGTILGYGSPRSGRLVAISGRIVP